jgi:hypothetical protein
MDPNLPQQPVQVPVRSDNMIPVPQPIRTVQTVEQPTPTPQPIVPSEPISEPAPQPANLIPPETKKSKGPILFLLLFFILILGMGGYYVYQKYLTQKTLPVPTPMPTAALTPKPTPVPTEDPTVGWKTYTNNTALYSFKYPSIWNLLDLTKGAQVEIYYQPDKTKSVGELLIEKIDKEPSDIAKYIDKKTIGGLAAKCKSDQTVKTWCYIEVGTSSKISILITKDKNLTYNETLDQILSTFKFLDKNVTNSPSPSSSPVPTPPTGWIPNVFEAQKLTIFAPSDWESSITDFTSTKSSLVKFWKKVTPDTVPIQLDIKPDWTGTGTAKDQTKNYTVGGSIKAYRIDPPKKEDQTLERYQTNVYFEYLSKVYVFTCVHNWVTDYVDTCNKMLETLTFTK